MNTAQIEISSDEIARRAYELWEARGRPLGDGAEDWEAAVAALTAERRGNGATRSLRRLFKRVRHKVAGQQI